MSSKLMVTKQEYDELVALKLIVSDKSNSPGIRRLAMTSFNRLIKEILSKNTN